MINNFLRILFKDLVSAINIYHIYILDLCTTIFEFPEILESWLSKQNSSQNNVPQIKIEAIYHTTAFFRHAD